MRKTQAKLETVQLMDVWPPVELSAEQIPAKQALQWAAQRIVELKACNLRFVRAMDTAHVNPDKLSKEFFRNLEFFGTADGYLTVALEMLRTRNCSAQHVSTLFEAIGGLADSLGEARREMLSAMAETLKTVVLESESRVPIEPKDIEEELAEIRQIRVRPKRVRTHVSVR
jgi:hypothetical protein